MTVSGRLSANDIALVRAAALDVLGLALNANTVIAQDVQEGRLVPVLLDQIGADFPISLVYAAREYIDPKLHEFVKCAAKEIAQEMPKPLDPGPVLG